MISTDDSPKWVHAWRMISAGSEFKRTVHPSTPRACNALTAAGPAARCRTSGVVRVEMERGFVPNFCGSQLPSFGASSRPLAARPSASSARRGVDSKAKGEAEVKVEVSVTAPCTSRLSVSRSRAVQFSELVTLSGLTREAFSTANSQRRVSFRCARCFAGVFRQQGSRRRPAQYDFSRELNDPG